MEDNSVMGAARRVAGRLEAVTGALTGDTRAEIRGKVREFGGLMQQRYGDATDRARDMVGSRSVATLLAAGAAGLAVGFFLNSRR
jgi:uncharacterized protein YjbJ (UPF0337 family)